MYSNSSEESNVSDYSTESSDEDGMETAQINGTRILLPQGLCDREDVFREFFSQKLWNSLPDEHKTYLQTFLPQFPENDEEEKTITLQRLFNFESFKFSSPLHEFHQQLKAGYFRPDIARMRNIIQKAERKEAKHRYKNHKERLKNAVLKSRKNLLDQLRNLPPGLEPKFDKVDVSSVDLIRHQTKRRYFQILSSIRSKTAGDFSSDENYLGNTTVSLSRKQKRHLNSIKNSLQNCCEQKYCSTLTGKSSLLDLERYITPNSNPFYVNDETYQNLLKNHKKRKQEDPEDPQYNTRNITLTDVIHRTQLPYLKIVQVQPPKNSVSEHRPPYRKKIKKETVYNYSAPSAPLIPPHLSSNSDNDSDSDSFIDAVTVQPPKQRKSENKVVKAPKIQTIKPIKVEVKEESEDVRLVPVSQESLSVNTSSNTISPISSYSQYGKIMPVTLSDLEGIDMMNLPIDLDNSNIDILEVNNKPELMQETHSNFLSLLRDIICSTTEHRMDFYALEKRLQTWQESPISPLNDWYSLCESWVRVLQSAINFLCGNATELPNDFVPYLEFKQLINSYQWIGAGRDSDSLLAPLCVFWLERRDELKTVKQKEEVDIEISDRTQTPPPPRCPTNWTVRKANQESIERFQEQEKRRYENPHRAFTYCCNGYESVVAPLKGIYNPSVGSAKARGHTILTTDRPNFVTILSLVRDATARLPNGEGTRGDIAELLKYSQYISPTATDSVLQTVVSGALDRMHTQFDPCVKYEAKRKIWIYLHRNRSEEDFEKIHQHLQGVAKIPKKAPKKSPTKKVKQLNKMKSTKESNTTLENVSDKTKTTKKSSPMLNAALSPALASPKSNSLLISNNIQQQREPSPPTIQILETVPSSPSKMQEEQEINEALQAIVENRISSPKLSKPKNVVKILQPSQNKSLVLPSLCTSSQVRHDKMIPAKQSNVQQQMISQQLLQMAGQKQTIQIIQTSEDGDKKSKLPSVFQQQQIIQNVTPQQLQNIKNVTLLRNSSPSATLTSTSDMGEVQSVTVTVNKPIVSMSDQIVQPGIQIKTPNNLTPAQQQQILQTIKQKILPQTMLASQQQQLLLKQKMVQVQKQNQNSTSGISLLGQTTKLNIDTSTPKPGIVSTQAPVVAKVLTNAAGQVISVESLLAHQKQHGSLPQGTTLRVSSTKGGQPNIIHLTGTSKQNAIAQFAVASQNNLITLTTQPKLVVATPSTTTMTSTVTSNKTTNRDRTSARNQQLTKIPTKMTQQLINAKIIQNIDGQKLVQPKLIVGQGAQVKLAATSGKNVALQKPTMSSIPTNSNSIRMVNTANLNLTHIGGKPVLLASKGSTIQNLQGQNVILQAQASSSGPSLVLQNSKSLQPSGVTQNASNINIINQQNVVLGSQVKMQQPQVVFKNSNINHVTQSHLVLGGQPVRLHTNNSSTTQRLVLASQGQGGQIVAQQILLPAGFQGTAINIKALQGVKVIPIAQSHGQNRNVQSRQVFARIVNPAITNKTPQNPTVTDKVEEPLSRSDV